MWPAVHIIYDRYPYPCLVVLVLEPSPYHGLLGFDFDCESDYSDCGHHNLTGPDLGLDLYRGADHLYHLFGMGGRPESVGDLLSVGGRNLARNLVCRYRHCARRLYLEVLGFWGVGVVLDLSPETESDSYHDCWISRHRKEDDHR